MSTMYASFVDAEAAERAAGALLDRGAVAEDLSIVANEAYNSVRAVNANVKAMDAERAAKGGISTTTPGDVAVGAVKGAGVGLGVGVAAALVSIFVPGLGLVMGGGALATALAGSAASVLAGSAAGSVVGYLRDQGVPEELATRYSNDFVQGGAILAVAIPTGDLTPGEVEAVLVKYGSMNVATYNSTKVLIDDPVAHAPKVPLEVDNPNIDPIAVTPAVEVVEPIPVQTTRVVDASTGEERIVTKEVVPTAAVIDPVTGVERPATPADTLAGEAVVPVETEVIVETDDPVVRRSDAELY